MPLTRYSQLAIKTRGISQAAFIELERKQAIYLALSLSLGYEHEVTAKKELAIGEPDG